MASSGTIGSVESDEACVTDVGGSVGDRLGEAADLEAVALGTSWFDETVPFGRGGSSFAKVESLAAAAFASLAFALRCLAVILELLTMRSLCYGPNATFERSTISER